METLFEVGAFKRRKMQLEGEGWSTTTVVVIDQMTGKVTLSFSSVDTLKKFFEGIDPLGAGGGFLVKFE